MQVLDKMVLYLRIVHSVDFYNHSEYPNEDEMPNRLPDADQAFFFFSERKPLYTFSPHMSASPSRFVHILELFSVGGLVYLVVL